jgi:hypothetical protein
MRSNPIVRARSVILILGAILLVGAVSTYIHALDLEHSRNWQPLAYPVSLVPGTIATPNLGNDLSGDYEIGMAFQQTPSLDKLACLVGNGRFDPNGCSGISDMLNIEWSLVDNGKIVQKDSSDDNPTIEFSSPEVYRRIGRFKAQKGHEYALTLNVVRDAAALNVAHPRILVRVPRTVSKEYGAGAAVEKFLAALLALLGIILLVGAYFFYRWESNRHASDR